MSNIQEQGPLMDKIHCFDSEIDLGAALGGGGVSSWLLTSWQERKGTWSFPPEDISPSPSPDQGKVDQSGPCHPPFVFLSPQAELLLT